MSDSPSPQPSVAARRYRAHLVSETEWTERGMAFRSQGERGVLEWSRVQYALAAEVGEPEGIRTIVFDLVVERDGRSCVVYRLDADPGEEAREVARRIEIALGVDRTAASVKSLAADGIPSRWFPDLEAFEESNLEALGSQEPDPGFARPPAGSRGSR